MVYAGFWRRFAAWVIDSVIVMVVFLLIALMTFGEKDLNDMTPLMGTWVRDLMLPLLNVAYCVWLDSSKLQGTIGKCLLGMRVVTVKGERLSLGRALWRTLGVVLVAMTFGLGFVIMRLMKKRQGFQDLMAGSVVVYQDSQEQTA
jgi:uncharacterized RDD family membrane protein YckC